MPRPDADPVDYYDRSAITLAPAYESVSFDEVHGALMRHLPPAPANILDVGAGTGRDARALARLGHLVVAVEPAAAFRELGRKAGQRVDWFNDRLPGLQKVRASGQRFDFILCSAVLMSVTDNELGMSFASMASLLSDKGKLAISVRSPAPDALSTVLHRHSDEAILDASARADLSLLDSKLLEDALGRPITWRSFVFARAKARRVSPEAPAPPR